MIETTPAQSINSQHLAPGSIGIHEFLTFVEQASALPAKAPVCVAILICGQSLRLNRRDHLLLTPQIIKAAQLNRTSVYRGLEQLESAGLITVSRTRGRSPSVSLLTN